MQRVSALLPSWDRNRTSVGSSKTSLDKVRGWADKIPSPVNRLSTSSRFGKESYGPSTLDRECDKAARILRSFCCDGFIVPEDRPSTPSTMSSYSSTGNRLLKKIPPRIIQNAVGLAVFTSVRSGLWASGSGGSGILMARKTDGTWSPPSALLLQIASLGFLGVDIYDCIVVINSFSSLEIFARPKLILGTDVQLTGGPLASFGLLENEFTWADLGDSVFTYVKSRGQASDAKLEGTILSERGDENERFYGSNFSVAKILAGDINQSLPQLRALTEVLKAAEGRTDFDAALLEQLANQPTPGDSILESPSSATSLSPSFGIPDVEDPDPFGILALGLAGMEIREAGTGKRPDSSQFEYCPSPTSSIFPRIKRQSADTYLSKSNRESYLSNGTIATERSQVTDAGVHQTIIDNPTPQTTPSPGRSEDEHAPSTEELPQIKEPLEVDYTQIDISALRNLSAFPDLDDEPITTTITPPEEETSDGDELAPQPQALHDDEVEGDADDEEEDDDDLDGDNLPNSDDDGDEEFEDAEEPVVYEVATVQPPRMAIVAAQAVQVKGAVVNIPRRVPPPLPVRSPARLSRRSKSEFGDVSMISSPLRNEFELDLPSEDIVTPRAGETFPSSDLEDHLGTPTNEEFDIIAPEESSVIDHPDTPTQKVQAVLVQPELSESGEGHNDPTTHMSTDSDQNDGEHEKISEPGPSHIVTLAVE
ncbi:hypothetical protein BX600DRAFT_21369 [Xylariales sp. PMI_506]|nr:hypothetical protein BX600DRAFT_21369 [Xylariales sp. PMI_506]